MPSAAFNGRGFTGVERVPDAASTRVNLGAAEGAFIIGLLPGTRKRNRNRFYQNSLAKHIGKHR
jgi:hypothetical protein